MNPRKSVAKGRTTKGKSATSAVGKRPAPNPAGYSGTPLPKKLGIKPDSTLTLISPPSNFLATLGPLPDGARVARSRRAATDLIILFVRSMAELKKGIAMLAARDDETHVWISWPKQSSPLAGNVSETQVRELGLAAGMVDFKVCAIDADWSGLKFSRKRK